MIKIINKRLEKEMDEMHGGVGEWAEEELKKSGYIKPEEPTKERIQKPEKTYPKEPIKNYNDNYHFSGLAGYLRAYIIFLIILTIIARITAGDVFDRSFVYIGASFLFFLIAVPMFIVGKKTQEAVEAAKWQYEEAWRRYEYKRKQIDEEYPKQMNEYRKREE